MNESSQVKKSQVDFKAYKAGGLGEYKSFSKTITVCCFDVISQNKV